MRTVGDLVAELSRFPPDALCYAYEGEVRGVVVVTAEVVTHPNGGQGRDELGHVPCGESDDEENTPAVREGA
jgi:hypothetical protein